jgi:hypothetical protein
MQFKEPSIVDFMAFTSSAHEVNPNDPPKFDDGPISQAEVAKLVLDQQVSLTQKLQESREALEARLNILEGKTTNSDQSGVLPPPEFGMPQGFFKNQSSISEASKLKSVSSASLADKTGHVGTSATASVQQSAQTL